MKLNLSILLILISGMFSFRLRSKFENKVNLKAKSTLKTKEGEEEGAGGAAESDFKSVPSVPEESLLEGIILILKAFSDWQQTRLLKMVL